MPADFIINADQRVVFSRATGALTLAEVNGHMDRLTADARFQPDFRQIFDFREALPVQLTMPEVRQLAERQIFGPGSRRAFVVSSELQYGLCRMFGLHREVRGEPSIRVFRNLPEAIAWIEVPEEIAHQAFSSLRERMSARTAPLEPPRQTSA